MSLINELEKRSAALLAVINKLVLVIAVLVTGLIAIPFFIYYDSQPDSSNKKTADTFVPKVETNKDTVAYWIAPDISNITNLKHKEQVIYGKELIVHTSTYFGPNGSVLKISNGLNCQNCHLQAGTAVFGNNYGSVASLFPKFRARSGTIENIYKRVNDCFERSLNGLAIDTAGTAMQAIVAYIIFLGTNVEKGKKAAGSGFKDMAYLNRAANPEKGLVVFKAKCQSCHQANGEGVLNGDKTQFIYPALWGNSSYNDGAGLYRLGTFAKYIKYNMPQGTTYLNPQLTDEEAWDVAAFVNTQPRPHINKPLDWPDKSKKPVDDPFGPYLDNFTEQQHKYGPYQPIEVTLQKWQVAERKVKENVIVKSK